MKKIIMIMIFGLIGCAVAQNIGERYAKKYDNTGTYLYIGEARTTATTVGTPSETNSTWAIIRYTFDETGKVIQKAHGYNPAQTGDASVYTLKWSDRSTTNIVYK
jgi:hypothetical protein